ncbi:hypothetical protein VB713_08525 [Anabaena cylindrica UHCC 0172]|uniref:hypothetical protein n=1 Tax=Anabaena cylindrica TaxID=1165 RepID=UPI002B212816|nr:hypothetical protein [Anabaena cylindrica]MEA5551021.1 hypothetical protein [Anabaena cylindrica UHCC 0172]
MKLQKTKKTSKLEQASTLLNQINDSNLQQVSGGSGINEYPFGVPAGSPGGPWTYSWGPDGMEAPRLQRHDNLN